MTQVLTVQCKLGVTTEQAKKLIEAIFIAISKKPKYVLDADIAKCFDRIDHEQLLEKLNTYPTLRKQIRSWLKAGVMDGKVITMRQ